MALTKSEKLQKKIGHKIPCEICGEKKVLTPEWKMDIRGRIACPECVKENPDRLWVSF